MKKNKKIALVLSGGGAKGSFQNGAEKTARMEFGYQWDYIAGVSTGALNAIMLAMGKYGDLNRLWETITEKQIMTGSKAWYRVLLRVARKKLSIYDNKPLRQLLSRHVDPSKIRVEKLMIGVVDIISGQFIDVFQYWDRLLDYIVASTAIPVFFSPVEIGGNWFVDGGVRNVSPLGSVIKYDPDEIVIINCSDPDTIGTGKPPKSMIDVATRSLQILTNEAFKNDLSEFLRINALVKQAEAQSAILRKENGDPYKYFKCTLIEPTENLGETLDFNREVLNRRIQHGIDRARAVLS